MSSAPLPMNREQRRKAKAGKRTHENTPLMVAFVQRVERQFPDGSVAAVSYFAPVTADGHPILEDAGVDGPEMILFPSQPVVIKRPSLIVTGPGGLKR